MEEPMPLSFLKRLQHVQLPVRVACPEEIRHVTVLVATGLIDAEMTTPAPTKPHAVPRLATVIRITDDGRAELATMSEMPALVARPMQFTRGVRLM